MKEIQKQYKRLKRHYESSLNKDEISFLDLAHTLRIWTELKGFIDRIAIEESILLGFEISNKYSKIYRSIFKNSEFISLPLSSGVPSPKMEIKGLALVNRAISPEEVKKLYEQGPPNTRSTKLSFTEWLSTEIFRTSATIEGNKTILPISREILIKRVANFLGASHPVGTDVADTRENLFDEHIKKLHSLIIVDYPATYYALLEVAEMIINNPGIKKLVGE